MSPSSLPKYLFYEKQTSKCLRVFERTPTAAATLYDATV